MIKDSEFNPIDAEEIVRIFSFPRLVGSEGEHKAMNLIDAKFDEIGMKYTKEPFMATKFWVSDFFRLGVIFVFLLLAVMVILSIIAPVWNILVLFVILAFAIYGLRLAGGENIKPIGKLIPTNNLIAKIPPTHEKKRLLIYLGHHDSKSQPLRTIQRTAFVTFGAASLLIVLLIFITQAIMTIFSASPFPNAALFTGYGFVGITALCCIPLAINDVKNLSPGALDNASSIATLFQLMKYYQTHPLKHTELWFLLTGGEEIGMMGAHEFVQKHKDEFRTQPTFALNFDMVGCKGCPIEVLASAGFPKPKRISPFLAKLAKSAAIEHGFPFRKFYLPIGAATDRFLFSRTGVEALDFINQKAAFETHSKNDTPEKYDPRLGTQVAIVAAEIGTVLDSQPGG
jgi:hypothetical protein